jgi:predicted RNA-binding protein Jag
MSETQGSPAAAASAPLDPAAAAEDAAKKRAKTTEVLEEVLRKMDLSGRAEVKDGPDGGISVALFVEGEVPQGQGRRSNFIDAVQFLANKIVNRPGTSKRWISIGLGAHPEPRPPRDQRPPQQPHPPPAPAAAPQQPPPPRPPKAAAPNGGAPGVPAPQQQQQRPPRGSGPKPGHGQPHAQPPGGGAPAAAPVEREPPEATVEVAEDPSLAALAKTLAQRSAELGRFYAVSPMKLEDRARLFRAAQGVAGVKVKLEGDGRSRRVVFAPDKPTPMPKRALPVQDDEA